MKSQGYKIICTDELGNPYEVGFKDWNQLSGHVEAKLKHTRHQVHSCVEIFHKAIEVPSMKKGTR